MRRTKVIFIVFLFFLALCVQVTQSAGQTKVQKVSARHTSPASGEAMFKAYCASCHGVDGKGNSAVAPVLKKPVPDLTLLAEQNSGKFPYFHVVQEIRGDVNNPSHGLRDMPIWGPVFLPMSDHQPAQVKQRLRNLSKHIESLQRQ
jgi:mono/diheme cytochrome c family protein